MITLQGKAFDVFERGVTAGQLGPTRYDLGRPEIPGSGDDGHRWGAQTSAGKRLGVWHLRGRRRLVGGED